MSAARGVWKSASMAEMSRSTLEPLAASSLCIAHEGEVLARGRGVPLGQVDLGERGRILGKRHPVDRAGVERGGPVQAPARRVHAGQPRGGARVAGPLGERPAHLALGPVQVAAAEAQQAELHARPGARLGSRPAGVNGQPHQGDGADPVALELAGVGRTAVGGQVGAKLEAPVDGGEALAVAAELDQGVGAHAERRDPGGRHGEAPPGPDERLAELCRVSARVPITSSASKLRGSTARARSAASVAVVFQDGSPVWRARSREAPARASRALSRFGSSARVACAWAIVASVVRGMAVAGVPPLSAVEEPRACDQHGHAHGEHDEGGERRQHRSGKTGDVGHQAGLM